MFISTAFAAQDGFLGFLSGQNSSLVVQILLIVAIFYVLLLRPQQKRMKDHQRMLETLKRGDRIVTGGGIIGTITRIEDRDELQVEIAEGLKVRVVRSTVSAILNKPGAPEAETKNKA